MGTPEIQALRLVRWNLFATFTFDSRTGHPSEIPSEAVQCKMFFTAARGLAKISGVHFHSLFWILRAERGEKNGRPHLHALFAGIPTRFVNERSCLALMSIWEHQRGGGIARCRVVSSASDALDYTLKDLDKEFEKRGADWYEFAKFGGRSIVTLSESLILRVGKNRFKTGDDGTRTRRSDNTQSGVGDMPTV